MDAHLVDFLPFEVADYLEGKTFAPCSMLIVGPTGSGKTRLLTALAGTAGTHLRLAGLSDLRAALPCLYGNPRALTLHVPRYLDRTTDADLPHLLHRQAVQVAVADDPPDQIWSQLPDLVNSGVAVWASTTTAREFPAELVLQLDDVATSGSVTTIRGGDRHVIYQAGPPDAAVFNPDGHGSGGREES